MTFFLNKKIHLIAEIANSHEGNIDLAKKRIRVNAITPGAFPNPKIQRNKNFIKNLKKKIPMNRIGQNHEINGAVIFLASDASSYVTGTNIPVDGGWLAW